MSVAPSRHNHIQLYSTNGVWQDRKDVKSLWFGCLVETGVVTHKPRENLLVRDQTDKRSNREWKGHMVASREDGLDRVSTVKDR